MWSGIYLTQIAQALHRQPKCLCSDKAVAPAPFDTWCQQRKTSFPSCANYSHQHAMNFTIFVAVAARLEILEDKTGL